MAGTIVPVCVEQAGAVASAVCPEGYALSHVVSVPFGAGEIDPDAAVELFGAFAVFFGFGLLLALLKKGLS